MPRTHLIVTTVLVLSCCACSAQQWPDAGCENAPDNFAKQYAHALNAYKSQDKVALKAALEEFELTPNWFAAHFGNKEGATLQKDYADQFAYFELDQLRKLHTISIFGSPEFEICPDHHPVPPVKPAPTSLVPIPDTHMVITHAGASWGDLYGFVDGSYKFFGTGGYPFWDPARIRLVDMCNPGVRNGGEITRRVEPQYPAEARGSGKQGKVTMRLTVSPEGSVTEAEIIDGDPVFVPAAKEAAMQWLFNPWTNCGKPVMMRTIETVSFAPPTEHQTQH